MANQRLNATITIGGVLGKSFKKNIGLIRSGFESVGDSIKDVKKRQKELEKAVVQLCWISVLTDTKDIQCPILRSIERKRK